MHEYSYIHQKKKHWKLDLTRISESLPAEKAAKVATEKVAEFVALLTELSAQLQMELP